MMSIAHAFASSPLSCCAWSVLVRWRPSPWAAVVTQLVTQPAFLSGILPGGFSLGAQPLSAGGWPALRVLLQSVSYLFTGGRHGTGQPGRLVPLPRRLLLEALRVFLCIRARHAPKAAGRDSGLGDRSRVPLRGWREPTTVLLCRAHNIRFSVTTARSSSPAMPARDVSVTEPSAGCRSTSGALTSSAISAATWPKLKRLSKRTSTLHRSP